MLKKNSRFNCLVIVILDYFSQGFSNQKHSHDESVYYSQNQNSFLMCLVFLANFVGAQQHTTAIVEFNLHHATANILHNYTSNIKNFKYENSEYDDINLRIKKKKIETQNLSNANIKCKISIENAENKTIK